MSTCTVIGLEESCKEIVGPIDYNIRLQYTVESTIRMIMMKFLLSFRINVSNDRKISNVRVVHFVSFRTQSSIFLNYRVIALSLSIPPVLSRPTISEQSCPP